MSTRTYSGARLRNRVYACETECMLASRLCTCAYGRIGVRTICVQLVTRAYRSIHLCRAVYACLPAYTRTSGHCVRACPCIRMHKALYTCVRLGTCSYRYICVRSALYACAVLCTRTKALYACVPMCYACVHLCTRAEPCVRCVRLCT